ncbi:MAG: NAD(P)/FAD-dependent oxidoreductase [Halioglobus sp.]
MNTIHKEVIIVGAGFTGIGAAIKLKEHALDFLLLEKAAEIGGVWRDNSYPGCECDIPSAFYSYSFAPNPKWSRFYAGQEEIKAYTQDTAAHYGLSPYIRLDHELLKAQWCEDEKHWKLTTNKGVFTANFVIMAGGPMHKPVFPAIKNLESFSGDSFHSAQWNHDLNLSGKKVAVIGSGASAIQFVPMIQAQVKQLALFQRTPPWVLPKVDANISDKWQARFTRYPLLQRLLRRCSYAVIEILNTGLKYKWFISILEKIATRAMNKDIKDSRVREQLTPDYNIGCKRILQSNTWFEALAQPNVSVLSGVREIDGNRVVDSNNQAFEADVIIFATGFEVANPPIANVIYADNGESLAQQWQGSPNTYHGTMAKNLPNCFLTFGSNLASFTSAFVIIEAQLNYILGALLQSRQQQIEAIEVNPGKTDSYNREVQAALEKTVWNRGGCSSYFIDKNGRNSTNWPWTNLKLARTLRHFDLRDYSIQYKKPV